MPIASALSICTHYQKCEETHVLEAEQVIVRGTYIGFSSLLQVKSKKVLDNTLYHINWAGVWKLVERLRFMNCT